MADSSSNFQARDRLTFLISLVPFLIERGRVSVAETARHFEVTEDQVRQSVSLLTVSGIPGVTATYQPDDLFDIAWDDFEQNDEIVLTNLIAINDSPRFSSREAAALIAGLQYLSSLPERSDQDLISALLVKLGKATFGTPSQLAVAEAPTNRAISLFREAVSNGYQVEFDYLNAKGEKERRRVDPLRVESLENDWYLRAWCHLREALRTFRMDRISNVTITDSPLEHHSSEVTMPESLFEGSADDIEIKIELPISATGLIAEYLTSDVVPVGDTGLGQVGLRVSHLHGLKRLVCSRPGLIKVLSPQEAVEMVHEWASEAIGQYSQS
ncbi:MAG: WYL domain-containing protein [Cryobacterium sp.]|nr:WYL domain-containing protein [Cryobacterium sp.]